MEVSSTTSTPTTTVRNPKGQLKVDDFINMLVTQLQNQDPMNPAKNEELMGQMSQIGQLQSQQQLQASLSAMVLQNNLGAAGNLIGKQIKGLDLEGKEITGQVTSVRVEKGEVSLELDSGKRLSLSSVTEIVGARPAPAAAGTPIAN